MTKSTKLPPLTNSSTQQILIHFEKVSFSYNKKIKPNETSNLKDSTNLTEQKWILKNLNATLYQNCLTLLKGKNGSGKSTLLKLLLHPQNANLSKGKISRYYTHEQVGYLSQHLHHCLKFPLTVLEFLCIQQPTLKKNDKKLRSLLEQLDLWKVRQQNFSELSGGQQQKTYLLRTLLTKPKIILMDEPLSYLDKESEKKFAKLIEDLLIEKTTIVMAIHDDCWLAHLSPATIKKYQINTLQLTSP